ncbi:MAG TPA: asparagine synthase-related protein [Allosphingosinicella sp.]|jgi:asparagine synthase (glutamine-hydrolysing)
MTALACFWSFGSGDDAARSCGNMLAAQGIYGPEPPQQWRDGETALGRRLFKLLPEDRFDQKPLVSPDGLNCLVADIRLDNRLELRLALGKSEAETRNRSDSALLMWALEAWGEEALPRLVGDFAFIYWEGRKRRLMLARDYLGHRPLHYHVARRFFACASMPKGLHVLAAVPVAPDTDIAAEFLALLPERPGASFFEGIECVPPGHVAFVTPEGVRTRKYWQPDPEPLRLPRPEEYEEALREKLDTAVGCMLRGAGDSVAAHLSGGLDSTAVASTAARLLAPAGRRLAAFTAAPRSGYRDGPSGAFADEESRAALVASQHSNIDHIVLRGPWSSPLDAADRNYFLYERPVLNLCNMTWSDAINAAARKQGLSVMLSGRRGNMGLSYSGMQHLATLLGKGKFRQLASLAGALLANQSRAGTIAAQTLGPYLPLPAWRAIQRLRGKPVSLDDYSAVRPEAVARLNLPARARELGFDLSYRPSRNGIEHRLRVLTGVDMGNYKKGQLAGWGIDSRDPLGDRRLIEFCLRVPEEQFTLGGIPRSLARRAMADRLPPAILQEKKKGYQGADWHEALTAAREEVARDLDRLSEIAASADTLDLAGMKRLVERWPSGSWHSQATTRDYRLKLLRGLSVGQFLRKASGSNR